MVQIGDIMQTVASSTSSADPEPLASLLHSPTVVFKLAVLTFVSLVPILARDRLKALIARTPEHDQAETKVAVVKDRKGKRWWFKQWRTPKAEDMAVMEMDVKSDPSAVTALS